MYEVDEITNAVMDIVRAEFQINPDSDYDDRIYTEIHNAVKNSKEKK